MTSVLITISFGVSLLACGLAGRLYLQNTIKGIEKFALVVFLTLFSFQTFLLIVHLASWPTYLQSARPYLAALVAPSCFWSITVLVRTKTKLKTIDLVHLLPFAINALHFVPFDYSLNAIQILYAGLMAYWVFDSRLNRRGTLKVATLLFAIIFAVLVVFDLFITNQIEKGVRLNESVALLISLFIIYSVLISITTISVVNPSVIHQILNDLEFTVNKSYPSGLEFESEEVLNQFEIIEDTLKQQEYFLEEDFSLGYLAECLKLTTRELSNVINVGAKKNFSAYINDLKIAKAKKLLRDGKASKVTITQVMFESGFTTKSSFNREFSRRTNMSPSQYKNSREKKQN